MYWFKEIKKIKFFAPALTLGATLFISCQDSKEPNALLSNQYYPIHDFFKKEIDSLTRVNPLVLKTVGKNEEEESQELHIKNWSTELGMFLNIDLSKPAYANELAIDSTENRIQYTSLSPDLDIKKITIHKDLNNQPYAIEILRSTKNTLYDNTEELIYVRGKSYSFSKKQDIIVIGENQYSITGEFK